MTYDLEKIRGGIADEISKTKDPLEVELSHYLLDLIDELFLARDVIKSFDSAVITPREDAIAMYLDVDWNACAKALDAYKKFVGEHARDTDGQPID